MRRERLVGGWQLETEDVRGVGKQSGGDGDKQCVSM